MRESLVRFVCRFLVLGACALASGARAEGTSAPFSRWANRVEGFRRDTTAHPQIARFHRALGAALVGAGQPAAAAAVLRRATQLDPREPAGFYLLGRALELAGDEEGALEAYARHAMTTDPGHARIVVAAHARRLFLASVRRVLRARLANGLGVLDSTQALGVAVPVFATFREDVRLRRLARGISANLITGLRHAGMRVTETAMLDTLLSEIATGSLGAPVRPSWRSASRWPIEPTFVEGARVLRTRTLVQGGVSRLDSGEFEFELAGFVVDCLTRTEDSLANEGLRGPVSQTPEIEKRLRTEVLPLIRAPRETSRGRKPRRERELRLAALEAYGQGMLDLDAARRGDATAEQRLASESAARQAFTAAVRLDPGFEGAREELDLLSIQPSDLSAYETQILEQIEHPADLDERLIRSGTLMGIGPGPGRGGSRLGDSGGRPRANTGVAIITIGGTLP